MNTKMKSGIWAIAIITAIVLILTYILKPLKQKTVSSEVNKKTVTMISEDGIELSADLYEPDSDNKKEKKKYPGIVLLSPFGRDARCRRDLRARRGLAHVSARVASLGRRGGLGRGFENLCPGRAQTICGRGRLSMLHPVPGKARGDHRLLPGRLAQ